MNLNAPQLVDQENWVWLNEGVQWIDLPVASFFSPKKIIYSEYKLWRRSHSMKYKYNFLTHSNFLMGL